MKKLFWVVGMVFLLGIALAPCASANTVSVYLDGIDALGFEIGGFQLMLDDSYAWPAATVDGEGPPTNFGNDFLLNGTRTIPGNQLGLAGDQPYSGLYWYIDTLIDSDDTDGVEHVRGIFGFDDFWDASWNKLNDGLLLTMSSSLNLAIDIDNVNTFFYDYDDEIIEGLQIASEWVGDDQVVNVSAVPIPGAIWLLGSGLVGLIGLKRRNRS